MLLTDEEINYMRVVDEPIDIEVDSINEIVIRGARAQLKKVVEWLEMRSYEEYCATAPENCYKRYRVMTIDIWQALLEEAAR